MTCSQMPGNLFPSHKLKGNPTSIAWAVTIRNYEAKENSSVKEEGEGEIDPSADEDVKVSSREEETDQTIEYIVDFGKVVELYQKKNKSCFGCGSPDHLIWNCSKDISKSAHSSVFKYERGNSKEGMPNPSEAGCHSSAIPRWDSMSIRILQKTPFLSPDPPAYLCGPENIAWVRIDDESSWVLLDNSSMINAVCWGSLPGCQSLE